MLYKVQITAYIWCRVKTIHQISGYSAQTLLVQVDCEDVALTIVT